MTTWFRGASVSGAVLGLVLAAHGLSQASEETWEGLYAGLHAGGGFADVDVTPGSLSPPGTPGSNFDAGGGMGGVMAGYNWQNEDFVFGIEADISFGKISGENRITGIPDLEIDQMASIRLRAGWVMDDFFIYGTAGFAFAHGESREDHGTGFKGSSNSHSGAIAGIGAELELTSRTTVRAEYQHGFFDEERYDFPESVLHTHGIAFDTDVIRLGFSVRLN